MNIKDIELSKLYISKHNVRNIVTDIDNLSKNIKNNGLINPIALNITP